MSTVTWLPAGHLLGARYRIEAPLGAGGFGQVYRASQLPLERTVAVKVLPTEALGSPERLARFEREAQLAQKLEHPNTVRMLDYGVSDDGTPFLVMELLRGESLASVLEREGGQPATRALIIASHVLKSLMEAHALGIVHRDVKPPNIFLTSHAGEPVFVKLLDFGVAKHVGADAPVSLRPTAAGESAATTHASQVMGTPRYMAPEQVAGETVGPTADLYALGLTLAETLTGRPVFDEEDAVKVCLSHMSADPVPLSEDVLASPLGPILQRATAKKPADRFESAEAMLRAVEAVRERAATAPMAPVQPALREGSLDLGAGFAPTQATPPMSRRVAPAVSEGIDAAAETERVPQTHAPYAVARWKLAGGALAFAALATGVALGIGAKRPPDGATTTESATSTPTVASAAPTAVATSSSAKHDVVTVPWIHAYERGAFSVPHEGKLRENVFERWRGAVEGAGLEVGDVTTSSSKYAKAVVASVRSKTCVGNLQLTEYQDAKTAHDFLPNLGQMYDGQVFAVVDDRTIVVIALQGRTLEAARSCSQKLENGLVRSK